MRWILLLVGLLGATQAYKYRYEGRIGNEVGLSGLRPIEKRHSVLSSIQVLAKEKFTAILGDALLSFNLHNIEIHGEKVNDPLPVLNGYFESSLTRDQLVPLFQAETSPVNLFVLAPVDSIPDVEYEPNEIDPAVTYCGNGGILFPNATCACPPFYSGDNCEIHNCANSGVLDSKGKCNCPPGFQSEHCQAKSCTPNVEDNLDFSTATLYFTLLTKDTMAQDMSLFIQNAKIVLNSLDVLNPGYFKTFVLTTFVQTSQSGTYMKTVGYTDSNVFYNDLLGLMISSGTATQPLITALAQTISTFPAQKGRSFIYLFADSDANDNGPISHDITSRAIQNQLVFGLLNWRIHPIYILSPQPGQPSYPTNTQSWNTILWIAEATHGDAYLVDKRTVGDVFADVLINHLNVENYFVANSILCSSINITMPAEAPTFLNVYNPDAIVNGTFKANGSSITVRPRGVYGNMKYYKLDPATYVYAVVSNPKNATDFCGARAYVNSLITVINSWAYDSNFDNGDVRMVQGMPGPIHNVAVLGGPVLETTIPWAPISTNDSKVIMQGDSLMKRTNSISCTFSWSVSSTFTCTPGPFTSQFKLDSGKVRLVPNYCVTSPKVVPATLKCLNGGVVANGKCNCTAGYAGNVCQTAICQNGGSTNMFPGNGQPQCLCNPGFTGLFCNALICNTTSRDDIDSTQRSFGVIVHATFSMAHIGSYFSSMIQKIVDGAVPGYYKEYILTTFNAPNATTMNLKTEKFPDGASFKNASYLQFGYSNVLDAAVLGAIKETIYAMSKPRSTIYLFVGASLRKEAGNTVDDIKQFAIERQMKIVIVIVPPYNDLNNCMQMSDQLIYQDLVFSSGGVLVDLCRSDTNLTGAFQFLPYYAINYDYQSEVTAVSVQSCTDPVKLHFQKFLPSQKFVIIANSVNASANGFIVTADNGTAKILTSITSVPSLGVYDTKDMMGDVTITVAEGGKECAVYIMEQTPLSAFITFTSDPSSDAAFTSPQLQAPLYPAARLSTSLQSRPDVTISATVKGSTNPIYSQKMQSRQDSCLYDLYANAAFACSTPNEEFFVTVQVVTPEITVSRVARAFCRVQDDSCINGGAYNGTLCLCQDGYSGVNCEIKACKNGASLSMGVCVCAPGYTGVFCENAMCTDWDYTAASDPRTHNFRTVAFGVEMSTTNAPGVAAFAVKIQSIMDEIQKDDFNTLYALVTYDDQAVRRRVITPDPVRFVQIVTGLSKETYRTVSPNVLTNQAITALHGMTSAPAAQNPSIITILTTSNTNKANSDIKLKEGTQVNFLYVSQKPIFNVTTPNYDYLNMMAYQSGGRVMPLTLASCTNSLDKIMGTMLRAHALVSDALVVDCSKGLSSQFYVESVATELYIDISGYTADPNSRVFDGAGKQVIFGSKNIIYNDQGSSMYFFQSNDTSITMAGTWKVNITTAQGRCQIQARVRSPIQVIPGFTKDLHDDFPQTDPPSLRAFLESGHNFSVYVTVQLPSFQTLGNIKLKSVDLYTKNITDGTLTYVSNTNLNRRYQYGCTNQYVSDLMKLNITTHDFQLIFGGVDSNGAQFTRTAIYSQEAQSNYICDKSQGSIDSYGFCVCSDTKYGGPHCNIPRCQNGGTLVGTACLCPTSYYGQFCENAMT